MLGLVLVLGLQASAGTVAPTPTPMYQPALAPEAPRDEVELTEGVRIRALPDERALSLAVVDADITLAVLERRGDWVLVAFGSFKGWALPSATGPGASAAVMVPGGPLRPHEPDPERLAQVKALLGPRLRERAFGPYRLLTDLGDERLVEELARVVPSVEESYRERFGLEPEAPSGEVVALFGKRAAYRELERAEESIAGLDSHGHAGKGIAAILADGRKRDDLRGVLVHELTHLLNRRAGLTLPPWLEEGLSDDLAYSRVDSDGRLRPGTLRGNLTETETRSLSARGASVRSLRLSLTGPQAAVNDAADAARRRGSAGLVELLRTPQEIFVRPENRPRTYPTSALFLRYLLDAEDGRRAPAFRRFLAALRQGGGADPETLAATLETGPVDETLARLENGFFSWLVRQQLPPERYPRGR